MTGSLERVNTRLGSDVDVHHGVEVPDPYRWLEDSDAPEVRAWVEEQNRRTRAALDALPSRSVWHARLCELMGLSVVQGLQSCGDVLILLERAAGAQQASLVVRPMSDPSDVSVLVDPAGAVDDDAAAIDWYHASQAGELVAFGVSEGGTENSELRIVRTTDGSLLDVRIPNCRASSIAWESDRTGFFYTRYPDGDQYHRTVHHHTIGSDGATDPVVWDRHPTPETWPNVTLSPGGRWLLVQSSVGWSRTDVEVLDRRSGAWRPVIAGVDAVSAFVFDSDDTIVGSTTLGAPRGRIVRVDLSSADPGPAGWVDVVAEREAVVTSVRSDAGGLVVATSTNGVDSIERWRADGARCVLIDGVGVSSVVQLASDPISGRTFALITGFDQQGAAWGVGATALERVHPAAASSDVPRLAVSHVEYPSIDGTPIGLFLIHGTDVEPNPTTPTILNGYGGFAITESPVWSPAIAAWCESGGLYAIAGLRGGFERGDEWHRAGRREHKQNVFDDFHAAADWLVATGRTSRDRLAIAGGSNGGLLVGAALTQRPDLCRAVWCAVPLLDMIRFPQFLIARLWTDEYGDPDVAEEFEWLMAYSPYHHVRDGVEYPAVLLTTAEGDSRVDPLHARKMAALLQAAGADQEERPVLLYQEGRAGHGVGKPVSKRAHEQADFLAFLSWQLGHDPR
jgi:prolyl oligopeptidase